MDIVHIAHLLTFKIYGYYPNNDGCSLKYNKKCSPTYMAICFSAINFFMKVTMTIHPY